MCVAKGDWSSPRCSRLTVWSKSSNSRFPGAGDRLVQPIHERESGVWGSALGPMRHNEERHAERVVAAPRLRRLERVAAADDGPDASDPLVEELLVRAGRLAPGFLLVAPRR